MILTFKEIVLKRISLEDIETLRNWRNQKDISENMFFQDIISSEMQLNWYESLNKKNDFYFNIIYRERKIGLINIKNIDWKKKEGEAGLYISINKYRSSPLAIYSSLALLKYFFEEKKLSKIFAVVKPNNTNIIEYNKSLGFEHLKNNKYVLSSAKYFSTTKNIFLKLL